MLGSRLRIVRENPVGHAVDRNRRASQLFQQSGQSHRSRTVHGIDHHPEFPLSDSLGIHQRQIQNRFNVLVDRTMHLTNLADLLPGHERKSPPAE